MVEMQQIPDRSIPEITPEQEAAYTTFDPTKIYPVGCGDDRFPTPESLALLPDDVEKDGSLVRYFGGIWGVTRVLAVGISQQYGIDAVKEHFSNDFVKFAMEVQQRVEAMTNLCFTVHSAEANEGGSQDMLNEESEDSVGCAYAALIGGVSKLNGDNNITLIATTEARELSQEEVAEKFESIVRANMDVFGLFFGNDEAASISRSQFIDTQMPGLILKGSHRHIEDGVQAVINFHDDKISNPEIADKQGGRFYNNDVVLVAKALMKAFADFKLDPRTLVDIMIADIVATRQALAGHESTDLNANDLTPARYGDYVTAITKLREYAREVY